MTMKSIEKSLQKLIAKLYNVPLENPLENVTINYAKIDASIKLPWEPDRIQIDFVKEDKQISDSVPRCIK